MIEIQTIGQLRISYNEFLSLTLTEFTELAGKRMEHRLDLSRDDALCYWSSNNIRIDKEKSIEAALAREMYNVTAGILYNLKSLHQVQTGVLLNYTLDTLRWDMQIECAAFEIPKGDLE